MKAMELFNMGKNHAEKLLIERGHIEPQMLVHVSIEDKMLDVIGLPIHDKDEQIQNKLRANVIAIIKAAKKRGIYEGSLMVSEAWMAMISKDKIVGTNYPRAKDDPNKIEVVIISAWGNGDKFSTAYRINKVDKKRTMGEAVLEGTSDFQSWLDETL
jgi:hypothetical protein